VPVFRLKGHNPRWWRKRLILPADLLGGTQQPDPDIGLGRKVGEEEVEQDSIFIKPFR
jgi:hypothetical protein